VRCAYRAGSNKPWLMALDTGESCQGEQEQYHLMSSEGGGAPDFD